MELPQYLNLESKVSSYLPPEQVAWIRRAYMTAKNAHEGQVRSSGEPYITHPIAVATLLADMRMDFETIMAGLLHDVVEDTQISMNQLSQMFGNKVAQLVSGVTKLDKLQFSNYKEAQVANLQKMVMAMVQDIRVIIIKLADRTHNMQTLGSLRPDKRRRIAKETIEIYTPIANRLGMHLVKDTLEDLCFKNLYPMRYRILSEAVSRSIKNREESIKQVIDESKAFLSKFGINATVFCRNISLINIYRKLREHRIEFHGLLDNYCFTIIVDSIDSCYRVLGIMHALYKPKPAEFAFKDYIAVPKSNGYQSLHTKLIGPHGIPIEMLIRTEFMDAMAEMGVVARWSYTTRDSSSMSAVQQQAERWMNNLLELHESVGNAFDFVENVKDELFPIEIFVLTANGSIVSLPAGSTPVDLAYAIDSDVGNKCIGARVDNHPYPLSRKLVSGQTVEIICSPLARPNPDWLKTVVSSKAKTKIKQYLNSLRDEECVVIGRRLFLNSLKNYGTSEKEFTESKVKMLLDETHLRSMREFFKQLAIGNELCDLSLRHVVACDGKFIVDSESGDKKFPVRGSFGSILSLCDCCRPVPGDEITAHMVPDQGLLVHRDNCPKLTNRIKTRTGKDRFIPVEWDSVLSDQRFLTTVVVEFTNGRGVMAAVLNQIGDCGVAIDDMATEKQDSSDYSMKLSLSVKNKDDINAIIRKVSMIPCVHSVKRV